MKQKIDEHIRTVQAIAVQIDLLERIAQRLINCFGSGGRVYLMGNGGSAADAQHIAAELIGRFKKNRRPLPAIALTTDTSVITAVSNDLGFEQIFERQIETLVTHHDIVWALSVSGTSPNVVRGLQAARKKKATVIGFTGASANDFEPLCDLCFRVDHTSSDRVQEVHQLAYHLICDAVETHFAKRG
jgi:D-sedoheptulose 7-phosphate isomerase